MYNSGSDCFECGEGCDTCSSVLGCDSCTNKIGYFVNAIKKICESCQAHCLTCNTGTKCSLCQSGYSTNKNQKCVSSNSKFIFSPTQTTQFLKNSQKFRIYIPDDEDVNVNSILNVKDAFVTTLIPEIRNNVFNASSRILQSYSAETTVERNQFEELFAVINYENVPNGVYLATATPAKGIFSNDGAFNFDITVNNEKEKSDTQKLAAFLEDFSYYLGYVLKVITVASLVLKVLFDIIFRDRESQGFFIWIILAFKIITRLRFIGVDYGIATSTFLDKLGSVSFGFKMDRDQIEADVYGITPKFYKFKVPTVPLYSMPVVSWLYPLLFVIRASLKLFSSNFFTFNHNHSRKTLTKALISYYFLKLYFIFFVVSAIDITFFGIRTLAHIYSVDTTFRGSFCYIHAFVLLTLVFIDISIIIGSVLSLPTPGNNRWVWTGCYFFPEEHKDTLPEDSPNQIEIVSGVRTSPEVSSPVKRQ